ncbi:SAV_915 family protein [Streptomyces sp. NPDC091267]|uniref:SAV_915 family protein n=1 Tax=unclassified Streptomyces TaxID=2593676 RepID=UPI00344652D3
MNDHQRAEDPDPLERNRTGALFVPVRSGPAGHCVRLFRTPLGARTAVAFTDERRLALTLGQRQTWIRLSEPAVRALVAPLGALGLVVDPLLAAPGPGAAPTAQRAPSPAPASQQESRPVRNARPAGGVRATGSAAVVPGIDLLIG